MRLYAALPAESGGFRERLFHDRRGFDEDLHVGVLARFLTSHWASIFSLPLMMSW